MKNLRSKGMCTLNELHDIISDLKQAIYLATTINDDLGVSVNVNIETIVLKYDKGSYEASITYEAKKEDYERDDEEGPFDEAT